MNEIVHVSCHAVRTQGICQLLLSVAIVTCHVPSSGLSIFHALLGMHYFYTNFKDKETQRHAVQELAPGHQLSLPEPGFNPLSSTKGLFPVAHPALELAPGFCISIRPRAHIIFFSTCLTFEVVGGSSQKTRILVLHLSGSLVLHKLPIQCNF